MKRENNLVTLVLLLFVGTIIAYYAFDLDHFLPDLPSSDRSFWETTSDPIFWTQLAGGLVGVWIIFELVRYAIRFGIRMYYRKKSLPDVRFIEIIPSTSTTVAVSKIMSMVRTFGNMQREWSEKWKKGNPWYRLRIYYDEKDGLIKIYFGYPQDKESNVKDIWQSTYPEAEVFDVKHSEVPIPKEGGAGGHFLLRRGRKKGLPLSSFPSKKESHLGDILASLRPGAMIDIQFSVAKWKDLEERTEDAMDDLQGKKHSEMSPIEKAQKQSLNKQLTGRENTFHVVLSLWSNDRLAKATVRSVANGIVTAMNKDGAIRFYRHRFWNHLQTLHPVPILVPTLQMTWTDEELANLFHLPPGNHFIYEEPTDSQKKHGVMQHLKKGQRLLPDGVLTKGFELGNLYHPKVIDRAVSIVDDVFKSHMAIFGKNGSGKSAFVLHILKQIIHLWLEENDLASGFTLIDPKEDTVLTIKTFLLKMDKELKDQGLPGVDWSKVHYFDLGSQTHPIGLNLLHRYPGETHNQVAKRALDVLKNAYPDNESVMLLEKYADPAIKALLADDKQHSILELELVIDSDSGMRRRLIKKVKDVIVKRDLQKYEEDFKNGAKVSSLINRIQKFRNDEVLRRAFGQTNMTLDFKKCMDEGHILLFNAKGLSEEQLRLIGGFIVTQLYEVSKKRDNDTVLHPIVCEEVQMYEIPVMVDILALARSAGIPLIAMTQYPDRLKKWLFDALYENTNTVIACKQGAQSAERVQKLTAKNFSATDLQRLDRLIGATYTLDENGKEVALFLKADKPYIYGEDGNPTYWGDHRERRQAEKNRAFQRAKDKGAELQKRDCLPVEEIDEMINEYYLIDEKPEPEEPTNQAEQTHQESDQANELPQPETDNDPPPMSGPPRL
jgi:Helicase HerA, central domain